MTNALTTRPTAGIATEEQRQLLRDLVMKGATDQQVELVVNICNRYGFDPLLKHVVLIKGTLYVTRDGLLDNAHRSGKFDGIEVRAEQDKAGKWLATATVWVKGMTHPVTYSAYQSEHENNESPAWRKAPRAMTVKCAEVMALKRAFNVSLGTAEEMGHDDTPAPVTTAAITSAVQDGYSRVVNGTSQPDTETIVAGAAEVIDAETGEIQDGPRNPSQMHPASDKQIKAIFAIGKDAGWTNDELRDVMVERFGVEHSRDLTIGQASEFIDFLKGAAGEPEESPQPQLV